MSEITDLFKSLDEAYRPSVPLSEWAGDAHCSYCGRYGALGQCVSCGAPNEPIEWLDVTTHADRGPRFLAVRAPKFDVVKR